ncbi:glycosyltransferase family 39 protein, partial [Candidatus Curtissbacteria bacterium]|nr:glycosyltransferase family 39 protein [Candidatus Curtissbacteria bacterium]
MGMKRRYEDKPRSGTSFWELMKKHYLILALILFLTFVFRFPSLFEPFWYGDEGIFAAVARNLNFGGVLYQDAWDNKPPMIYLTYAVIFKLFGVSMFWLRLTGAIVVLVTATVIYELAQKVLGKKRALLAAFAFGFLTSLRLLEGNLALTEIFMVLPITLAMMIAILRKFDWQSCFAAGILFAVASLYKQVGALEAAALGIFLFLDTKSFSQFFKKGLALSAGFSIPFLVTVAYFAPKNLVGEYIFAAYTYYQIYLGESPRYAILVNILKFIPILAAAVYGLWKKAGGKVRVFHLFLLWSAFSYLGSYFSGRTYGHYLVQAAPAVSLLLASVSWRPIITRARLIFALSFFIPLVFLTKLLFTDFLSGGPLNQI